jgi:hypothetical protein
MATPNPAGYSGTPLAKKLGIKAGMRVWLLNPPPQLSELLAPLPEPLQWANAAGTDVDLVHVFTTQRSELQACLTRWREQLNPSAVVWVSWPKKAAKVPTDITEDVIREVCLPLGWVDVKVCAVDATWSGLKLVVRKVLR